MPTPDDPLEMLRGLNAALEKQIAVVESSNDSMSGFWSTYLRVLNSGLGEVIDGFVLERQKWPLGK